MALRDYTIEYFRGLDQSQNENRLDPGMTADGANMITEKGNLTVGYGFRHTFDPTIFPDSRVPGSGTIWRMYYWHTLSDDKFIVCAGDYIYAWDGSQWVAIMDYSAAGLLDDVRYYTDRNVLFDKATYMTGAGSVGEKTFTYDGTNWKLNGSTANLLTYGIVVEDDSLVSGDTITVKWKKISITSRKWDFVECRLGNDDYLLISNGQTQIVKWNGAATANAAEVFGTGGWVYQSTASALTYTATKATAVSYAEASDVGTFTLTMPSGWSYSQGTLVAFTVPSVMNVTKSAVVKIGSTSYTLDWLPIWSTGDVAVVELTGSSSATKSDTEYGVKKVTLAAAMSSDIQARCRNIGLRVDGITYDVESIDSTGKIVTLKEPITKEISTGVVCLVRGGVSDIPVNYMELYYNRLLCAGDPDHPSRLYWSQPPGDTRTIEDWSMDDASEVSSGGHTDVGNTSSDPIVALVALSNQLLIFKEASVWRLIGDRPSNYSVSRVNKDMEMTTNSSIIANGDIPYWITRAGMYYHDGQTAHLSPTARQIQTLLEEVDLTNCKSCENRDRLYYSCRAGDGDEDDTLIVYDMKERVHLIRNGFNLTDICSYDGVIYMINSDRFVYQWDRDCHTYAGYKDGQTVENPIFAYWNTPFTDLQARSVTKHVKWLYLRGSGDKVLVDIKAGPYVQHETYAMPAKQGDIIRIPLRYEGRAIGLKLQNIAGGWFEVEGGLTLRYEAKEDGT